MIIILSADSIKDVFLCHLQILGYVYIPWLPSSMAIVINSRVNLSHAALFWLFLQSFAFKYSEIIESI